MDSSFLEAQANRCRSLAENADQFTKRRLLDLAAKYYARLGHPSRNGEKAATLRAQIMPRRIGAPDDRCQMIKRRIPDLVDAQDGVE